LYETENNNKKILGEKILSGPKIEEMAIHAKK
jgi:hypothetical protein